MVQKTLLHSQHVIMVLRGGDPAGNFFGGILGKSLNPFPTGLHALQRDGIIDPITDIAKGGVTLT